MKRHGLTIELHAVQCPFAPLLRLLSVSALRRTWLDLPAQPGGLSNTLFPRRGVLGRARSTHGSWRISQLAQEGQV